MSNTATSGAVGNIWFAADGYTFPSAHWLDFAEVITGWWISELIDIYRSNNKWYEKDLLFMDGPCEVMLRNTAPTTIHFKRDDRVTMSFSISLPTLAQEILSKRRELLYHVAAVGWRKAVRSELERCNWLEMLVQQAQDK